VTPKTLDHVAFWVEDRDAIADFATTHLGMHVIDRTERFTLIGSDARHGKLTLFDAEGPREPGALKHVALRVSDLEAARDALPDGAGDELDLADGVRVRLVEAPTEIEYDLDHVALLAPDPARTAEEYLRLGFNAADPRDGAERVEVGGAFVEFHRGEPGDPDKPLLNHLAVLVDSADEHIAEAKDLGVEIDDVVDAPNTYAVFLRGPERVRIEYVEHKPTFSLR
jgi:catechol 2,3-dioxygenase-like lactoylglutathione lyase family enzyme